MKRIICFAVLFFGTILLSQSCLKTPSETLNTPSSITFSCDGGSQSITFTCNRDWSASSSESWLQVSPTSGTASDGEITVTITCAENTTYDNREGKITLKQTDGGLSETVVVTQSQTDGLFITTPEYSLSDETQILTVEIKANVEVDVTSIADWIKYVSTQTKDLTPSQVTLQIEANESNNKREGKVLLKQKGGDLSGIITVRQDGSYGIFVSQESVSISKDAQSVEVEVKYSVDFDVIIPSEAQGTIIKSVEYDDGGGYTKALSTRKYRFGIAENTTYETRVAIITFKQRDGSLSDTFTITQEETKTVLVSKNHFDIQPQGGTFDVKFSYNVPYTIEIKDNTWIQQLETKSLSSETVSFSVSENTNDKKREGTIIVSASTINLEEIITVTQYGSGYYYGDISISSREQLIEWGNSNVEFIDGDVNIKAIDGIASLSDLNNKWKGISGELYIDGSNLSSLDGLKSLESLGAFTLHHFSGESLTGLSSLREVQRFLSFEGPCRPMRDFTGLEKLEKIGGSLKFSGEWPDFHEIQSFNGFNALKTIGGDLMLYSDFNNLATLNGLNSLEEVGGSVILRHVYPTWYYSFDNLKDFQGLNSLKRIGGDFVLDGSFDGLVNFKGLEKLEYIGGTLDFGTAGSSDYSNFNSLESLDGLSSLYHIGFLGIMADDRVLNKLVSLKGLESVTFLGGCYIASNHLESFDALSNISNKEMSRLIVLMCPIKDLNCFKTIETVTSDVAIGYCKFIKSLDGLKCLKNTLAIRINNCERLISIEFFSHVTSVNQIDIYNNESLYDFTPLYNLLSSGSGYGLNIYGNGYNPTREQIINGEGKP